jgi:surface protein
MLAMFMLAGSFNRNLSSWITSNVTSMREMFKSATLFNQDISGWAVNPNVTDCTDFNLQAHASMVPPIFTNC